MDELPHEPTADNISALSQEKVTRVEANEAARQAVREDRQQSLRHGIILALALFVPFIVVYLTSRGDEIGLKVYHGMRLGMASFMIALAILGLSQIDQKFLGTKHDTNSRILAGILGAMLWLVWVGSGEMVFRADDESTAGAIIDQGRR